MARRHLAALALAAAPCLLAAQGGTDYPREAIKIIVPFAPGGGTDYLSRLMATKLGETQKWNVVAENKPGAGGTIGIQEALRARPDGYAMVMGQKDNLVIAPWLYPQPPYDALAGLAPVAMVAESPLIIVARADSKYKTVKDMIEAARRDPGSVSFGSAGNGSLGHLAAELLQKAGGVKMQHIPYKGSLPAVNDLLGGHVDVIGTSIPSSLAQIKAGTIVPVAMTSAQRSPLLPDVPTIKEQTGYDIDISTWYGLFMPKGAPQPAVERVNAAVNQLLEDPAVRDGIASQGAQAKPMSPAGFARFFEEDSRKWEKIVKDSGVRIQ